MEVDHKSVIDTFHLTFNHGTIRQTRKILDKIAVVALCPFSWRQSATIIWIYNTSYAGVSWWLLLSISKRTSFSSYLLYLQSTHFIFPIYVYH